MLQSNLYCTCELLWTTDPIASSWSALLHFLVNAGVWVLAWFVIFMLFPSDLSFLSQPRLVFNTWGSCCESDENLCIIKTSQEPIPRCKCSASSIYIYIYNIYIYIYIYNRIEQCALPVTTIMALWQLVNLGTRCTVTHCRIALWSHQSAQTASSERCIMQIVNVSLRDSPPNP